MGISECCPPSYWTRPCWACLTISGRCLSFSKLHEALVSKWCFMSSLYVNQDITLHQVAMAPEMQIKRVQSSPAIQLNPGNDRFMAVKYDTGGSFNIHGTIKAQWKQLSSIGKGIRSAHARHSLFPFLPGKGSHLAAIGTNHDKYARIWPLSGVYIVT